MGSIVGTSGVLIFAPNQYAQSNVIYNNATPVTKANLTAVDTGDIDYYMASYDGTTAVFEQVTNGTDYTFTNSGNKVKWKAVESAGASATVTYLQVSIL